MTEVRKIISLDESLLIAFHELSIFRLHYFKKGRLANERLTFTFAFAYDWNLNFVKGIKSNRTVPHLSSWALIPLFKDDNSFSGKQCACVCVTNGNILC